MVIVAFHKALPLDLIVGRKAGTMYNADLDKLRDDILTRGMLNPLVVCWCPKRESLAISVGSNRLFVLRRLCKQTSPSIIVTPEEFLPKGCGEIARTPREISQLLQERYLYDDTWRGNIWLQERVDSC